MGLTRSRFPLSFAQQRLWLLDQLDPGRPYYNIATILRLTGPLDVPALSASLTEIARRHETLRTVCGVENGVPYQEIAPPSRFRLPIVDLGGLGNAAPRELERLARREGHRGFDLTRGPLFRAALVRLADQRFAMLANVHHVISDGWSYEIFARELVTLYDCCVTSRPSPLPELPIQYVDYAVWQRDELQGEELEKKIEHWRQRLSGMPPVLPLPIDRPRPPVQDHRGKLMRFSLDRGTGEDLRRLAASKRTSLFVPLLAGFAAILSRYSHQADLPIGIPVANRDRVEVENLIGFFINTVVLRCDLTDDPTFTDLVARLAELTLEAYAHQDVPFEKLVQELLEERDPSSTPLFQVMVSLREPAEELPSSEGVTFEHQEMALDVAKFDLSYDVESRGADVRIDQYYSTALFDDVTLSRLRTHVERVLAEIGRDPDRRVSEVSYLKTEERHQLLWEWNDSAWPVAGETLHERFSEQSRRTPEAVALSHADGSLSYGELDLRSNRIARYLRSEGVGPEVLVGVCSDGSPQIVTAVLGVLKAGGAYVPLDPTYPPDRLAFMIEDAGVSILLTREALLEHLPASEAKVLCLDRDWPTVALESSAPIDAGAVGSNLAYVIFTSGSTGRPKGVLVVHGGAVSLAQEFIRRLRLTPASRVLQFASFSYDVSAGDLFQTLLCGATLVLQPPDKLMPGEGLAQLMRREKISSVTMTPSALNACQGVELPALGTIMVGGEACPTEVKDAWARGRRLINAYGPTETTVCSSQIVCVPDGRKPSIGRPLGNTELYVLDARFHPVTIGVTGELYIGGVGVNRGYLERPALTAERFLPDPWSGRRGARLYRTGDRVRYLRDGQVDFLGRLDYQVKIRGFRIELGEIEARLREHAAVSEAAVEVKEVADGDLRLVAYVQQRAGESATASELREFLIANVPEFMVPASFVFLDEMPSSAAGKIDRQRLPEPEWGRSQATGSYVAPATEDEKRLTKICQAVLAVDRLGVQDDLFEVGLHSLLGMQLLSRIRQEFHVEIPFRRLFQGPTVQGLLEVIAQLSEVRSELTIQRVSRQADVAASVLVELQAKGSQPPLFCIHAADGEVHYFAELARLMGEEQPFFGLQMPDPVDFPDGFADLDEMIGVYLEAMRRVQPDGPYAIAGWSLGGVVAFQMAQRIRDSLGVSFLAVFDPTQPEDCELLDEEARILRLFAVELGIQAGKAFEVPEQELSRLKPEQRYNYLVMKARIAGVLAPDRELAEMRRIYEAFRDNLRLIDNCGLEPPYPGSVTYVHPEEGAEGRAEGWRAAFTGPYHLLRVPGDHYSFLKPPHVEALARGVRDALAASRRGEALAAAD